MQLTSTTAPNFCTSSITRTLDLHEEMHKPQWEHSPGPATMRSGESCSAAAKIAP